MTKSELIKRIAAKYPNLFTKDISKIVDIILDEISDNLAGDGRVELRGFGSFSVRDRKARAARNPKTNEMVYLSDRKALYFRAGKELKERINS